MDKKLFAKAWEVVEYFQEKESTEKMINLSEVPHILRAINLDMIFEKVYRDRDRSQYLTIDDISDFFQNYLRIHTVSAITPHELEIDLAEYIEARPDTFDFYFGLDDFYAIPEREDCVQIGNGRLYRLEALPEQIRYSIIRDWKNGRSKNLDGNNWISSIKHLWYIHVQVNSIGVHKAKMEAIRMVERCMH